MLLVHRMFLLSLLARLIPQIEGQTDESAGTGCSFEKCTFPYA